MSSFEDARRELLGVLDEKQAYMEIRRAKTGRGTGEDVDVDGMPGWIWIRFDSDQSKVSKVFSEIRKLPEDVPIIVGKPWPNAEHEQVIAVNWPLYYQGLTDLVLDQYTNPAHGDSHGEDGSDRAPIGLRNLEPGRARETNPVSLSVYVEQFRFTYGNIVVHWVGGVIDLTASVPAGVGHRYTLVSLDTETNTLFSTDGDIVPLAMAPTLVAIPAGHIPIAYVDLAQGEADIEDALIFDARLLWQAVGGVGDHTHSEPGDGGASLMCIEELFVEDLPVVMDGGTLTPYAFYHAVYVSGLYSHGNGVLEWIYPDEAYAGDCPQMVILRPGPFGLYDTYEILVKHNVGNIFLSGESDIMLNKQTDVLWLVYNGEYWVDLPGLALNLRGETVRLGQLTNNNEGMPGYGTRLYFSGGPSFGVYDSDNSDSLWAARYNVASDKTELRVNIGDDGGVDDAFVLGYVSFVDGLWHPIFRFQMDGNATIAGSITYTGNVILDDGVGDSPRVRWVGGTNDDTIDAYLIDDAIAGRSDLAIVLADAGGESRLLIQDSSPATVAYVDSNGNADFVGHVAVGGGASVDAAYVVNSREVTTANAGTYSAYYSQANSSPTANFTTTHYGIWGRSFLDTAQTQTANWFAGVRGDVFISNAIAGTLFRAYGGYFTIDAEDGIIVSGAGIRVYTPYVDTGSMTTGRGIWISQGTNNNVITTLYGLYIDAITAGGTNWAIYSAGGDSYHAGNVGIAMMPTANGLLCLGTPTENLEFIDAGSAGATEQDWIEVEVGGVQGFLRVFAAV